MEKKHENYHVRPFPQQPKRGGKELVATLDQLEVTLGSPMPNMEKLKTLQAKIHETAQNYNDDQLIDMLRQLSHGLDKYQQKPSRPALQKIVRQLLKVRIALKSMH